MSNQLQLFYDEFRDLKKERKDLKAMYKDALAQADDYEKICDQIVALREKKKEIESKIQKQLGRAWDKLGDLEIEIKTRKGMIDDEALNVLMSGNTVEVKDEFDNEYEPVWNVKFVKKQN